MEGIVPSDIFATKGLEYLIVIGFLLLLVGYWKLLSRPLPADAAARIGSRPVRRGWFSLPDHLLFHQGHTWAARAGEDIVTVGLDDFAQKLVGEPASVRLPQPGTALRQGERAWELDVDSRSVGMVSPVDGKVLSVNPRIQETPELVCADPYGEGWLMKVKVPGPSRMRRNLLSGSLARAWMSETVERLRAMRAGELGILLPDGGVPISGFVRELSPEGWADLAEEFFLSGDVDGAPRGEP